MFIMFIFLHCTPTALCICTLAHKPPENWPTALTALEDLLPPLSLPCLMFIFVNVFFFCFADVGRIVALGPSSPLTASLHSISCGDAMLPRVTCCIYEAIDLAHHRLDLGLGQRDV